MWIGGPEGGPLPFPAGLMSARAVAARLHNRAQTMDRSSGAMEKPACQLEAVDENASVRQSIEMEEIIACEILFCGGRRGWAAFTVGPRERRRGGKASVKSAEARERLGL